MLVITSIPICSGGARRQLSLRMEYSWVRSQHLCSMAHTNTKRSVFLHYLSLSSIHEQLNLTVVHSILYFTPNISRMRFLLIQEKLSWTHSDISHEEGILESKEILHTPVFTNTWVDLVRVRHHHFFWPLDLISRFLKVQCCAKIGKWRLKAKAKQLYLTCKNLSRGKIIIVLV